MTKGGGKKHLKRYVVSKHIPIHKKAFTYTVKPYPGPHAAHDCIPVTILLRDMFRFARNMSEVKKILFERNVVVDGRVRTNRKYPLGFMDVISFPKIKENYRMIYLAKKGLRVIPITEKETSVKLCQIKDKTTIKNGLTQLNLHDGRNILLPSEDATSSKYSTHDTIKISIPDQEILERYELKIGNYGFVTSGRWMGRHGTIEEISTHGRSPSKTVTLKTSDGEELVTLFRYIFVIGNDSPSITIEDKKKVKIDE
ncbi:MAG: 30S ribosomal protein S4e [Candidatus Heimdallarchaeota archaeon]|nr:30S ribosomal protein S4e [Candidatus Heimdallarchaeota archaeon]MCK4955573.1 30S ribosomal protein S4e [Candidatus Heimdallarchaeota archaeon]